LQEFQPVRQREYCGALQNERAVVQLGLKKKEPNLAKKKKVVRRAWTKDDLRLLKSMAKDKKGVTKIAKALKRTTRAVENKGYKLGVSLDTRG
jgi:hypothetical protein